MRFAYADPVYLGQARLYPENPWSGVWNNLQAHRWLIQHLTENYPDGWALSASSPSLSLLLPMCPPDHRIAAWCKSFCVFKKGVRPCYAWEPVIYWRGRNKNHPPPEKGGQQTTPKDFLVCPITLKKGLTGAKPPQFCSWVLDLLNFQPGDALDDLYPGTGAMGAAVLKYFNGGVDPYDSVR